MNFGAKIVFCIYNCKYSMRFYISKCKNNFVFYIYKLKFLYYAI